MTRAEFIRSMVGVALAGASPVRLAAADAATEPLAVVVNKSNPVDDLSLEELRKLCLGEKQHWSGGWRVTVALRSPGQAEFDAVLAQVARMTEVQYRRHFLHASFQGGVQGEPRRLSTGAGVVRFVFNVPGGLGFVRLGDVDESVKVLRVTGKLPGDPQYSLKVNRPSPAGGGQAL